MVTVRSISSFGRAEGLSLIIIFLFYNGNNAQKRTKWGDFVRFDPLSKGRIF